MADYEANADLIAKMKSGQGLVVQAINSTSQPISLVLPLADFAELDGPPLIRKVLKSSKETAGRIAAPRRQPARSWKANEVEQVWQRLMPYKLASKLASKRYSRLEQPALCVAQASSSGIWKNFDARVVAQLRANGAL